MSEEQQDTAELQARLAEALARAERMHEGMLVAVGAARKAEEAARNAERNVREAEENARRIEQAFTQSLSWRVTAPLRRASALKGAFVHAIHKLLVRVPVLHSFARPVARTVKLVPRHAPPAPASVASTQASQPVPPAEMTADAGRLHDMMKDG